MLAEHCHIIYNSKAGSGNGRYYAECIRISYGALVLGMTDITEIADYGDLLADIGEIAIVICGGDGTLNRFVNDTSRLNFKNPIYYFASGSGNDFLRDVTDSNQQREPICITDYIKNLPVCTVNGKKYRFINGVGYGIDGYCCEIGDKARETKARKVNYTSVAIKGILFDYKPTSAEITVDGVKRKYERVWLAPAMNGRYYGGGMMAAPSQKRLDADRKLSLLVFHNAGKMRILTVLPLIFKGKHIKNKRCVEVLEGHNINVRFDSPSPLQIDGETIKNVTEYCAEKY